MGKVVDVNEKMYHIGLSRADIKNAKYALLPGDPARVSKIAQAFGEYTELNFNREYKSALDKVEHEYVLICSTGMGGPSVGIGLEELAMIGVQKFIRIGTTGTIQEHVNIGDLIINKAAVRLEGTSTHYAPIEYPAAADLDLTYTLKKLAIEKNIPHHVGIGISSDSFWPGQERYGNFTGYVPNRFKGSMSEWRNLKALNYEMEAATLFTLANVFGLQAASICLTVAKRTQAETVLDKTKWPEIEQRLYKFTAEFIQYCIQNKI